MCPTKGYIGWYNYNDTSVKLCSTTVSAIWSKHNYNKIIIRVEVLKRLHPVKYTSFESCKVILNFRYTAMTLATNTSKQYEVSKEKKLEG